MRSASLTASQGYANYYRHTNQGALEVRCNLISERFGVIEGKEG